ncbi:MAG: gamma-glutamyl-gamma-aminobutyrate hydrolase family protein [Pirellulaceae bacterium]|nr:gamma-glutamyl-gamma-aminobutyrate hydrolase family protein [Planctomycetales bacterium]
MPRKPVIGINTDFHAANHQRPAYSVLAAGYFDCIHAAGGIPMIVPPIVGDDDDLNCILDQFDGFVLVGGADLDPRRDGFMLHPSVRHMDPRREVFDRRLMDLIASRRMPVFGIGAGMQLLNVSQGGNLLLHIPEDRPDALPHKDPQDEAHRHGLCVELGSLMERVYGDGEIRVNSRHHMAVDDVAPGFAITARSPDGIVEAIESIQDGWFAMGTQFHPESRSASALDMRIFEEFIAGITGDVVLQSDMRLVA